MAIPAPVAYYKLDTNSNDSVASANGTDTNVSYTNAGILNNSATFSGTGHIQLPAQTSLTGDWSVSFWIYRNTTGLQCPLTLGRQTNFGWFYFTSGNNFRYVEDNIADYASSITISTTGTWNHISVTKIGTAANNLTYYLNGSAAGTASVGSTTTPATAAYIGAYTANGSNFLYRFNGRFDEYGIFNTGLTSGQVSELHGGGTPPSYPFSTPAVVQPQFLGYAGL